MCEKKKPTSVRRFTLVVAPEVSRVATGWTGTLGAWILKSPDIPRNSSSARPANSKKKDENDQTWPCPYRFLNPHRTWQCLDLMVDWKHHSFRFGRTFDHQDHPWDLELSRVLNLYNPSLIVVWHLVNHWTKINNEWSSSEKENNSFVCLPSASVFQYYQQQKPLHQYSLLDLR